MPTPQYILDLRAVWGHRPLVLPGVSGVVFDASDDPRRVLLVRRSDNGLWSLPAGIVEPGEQPADTITRELWEETRVRVRVERLALLVSDDEVTYPNGDQCSFVSMCFRCRWISGDPVVGDEESTAVGWFALDALPADLRDRDHRRIAAALAPEGPCVFEQADG